MTDISIGVENRTGRITLRRPEALNALTWAQALAITEALELWQSDDRVTQVLIDAEGTRAFCSGGDIVTLYEEGILGLDANAKQFWRDEYRLNAMIATYPKPFIAAMDGFVMGGGVGISAHGSHRIVTDRTQFALPECGIGLVPDVGGSLILARMPGFLGEFAGLSSARLSGADCLYAGVGTHFVTGDRLENVKAAIISEGVEVLSGLTNPAGDAPLAAAQDEIDRVFSLPTLEEIIAASHGTETLNRARKALKRNSPLAMAVGLRIIRNARIHNDIYQSLRDEFRFTSRAVQQSDFLEGIRAAVIDKDRAPNWRYDTLNAIPDDLITAMQSRAVGGDVVF